MADFFKKVETVSEELDRMRLGLCVFERKKLREPNLCLSPHTHQMRFMLLFSRQGKLRLQKWYLATSDKERKKMVRELMQVVLARKPKMCSFLEWRDLKVVYKR